MKVAPTLPTVEALEDVKRRLIKVRGRFAQHLLFVDEEKSCNLSYGVTDPRAPLSDTLAGLARVGQVIDMRIEALVGLGMHLPTANGWCSVERLVGFVDKPRGHEMASTMLRRERHALESEAKHVEDSLATLENCAAMKIEYLIADVDKTISAELHSPTSMMISVMIDLMTSKDNLQAGIAREPEDAVWTTRLRDALECSERMLQCMNVERLHVHETLWRMLLMRAAEVGVEIGQRQALVTEFFDDEREEDDDNESEDNEGESDATEGMGD